jgi:hypothetical protein
LPDDDPLATTVTTAGGDHVRPVLLVLCADGDAVAGHLRRRFGAHYDVIAAGDETGALDTLREAAGPVALVIADEGREDFLAAAHDQSARNPHGVAGRFRRP